MTFSDQFIQIMDYIGEKLGIIIDWTSQNVSPYLFDLFSRLCQFMIAKHIVALIGFIIFGIICAFGAKKLFKICCCNSSDNEVWFFSGIGWIVLAVASVVLFIIAFGEIHSLVEAIYIPEKAVIEYLLEIKSLVE